MNEQLDLFVPSSKTTVVNIKNSAYDIYIGRSGMGSIWSNPFSHLDESRAMFKTKTRKEAIKKYHKYLLNNVELMSKLPELRGKVLGCHCKNKNGLGSCHGDILASLADKL